MKKLKQKYINAYQLETGSFALIDNEMVYIVDTFVDDQNLFFVEFYPLDNPKNFNKIKKIMPHIVVKVWVSE